MAVSSGAFKVVYLWRVSGFLVDDQKATDLGELTIAEKVFHNEEVHLSRLEFARPSAFPCFPECQFVTPKNFGQKCGALGTGSELG